METTFIDKSYVIGSILNCKQKLLNERFVTFYEANYIASELQQFFNLNDLNIIIIDNIEPYLYNITNVIQINKESNITLEGIREMSLLRFKSSEYNIWQLLWNESLMTELLIKCHRERLTQLHNEYINRDKKQKNKQKTKKREQ